MSTALYELVYVSESRLPKEPHAFELALGNIVSRAQTLNERANLTGALVTNGTHFAQLLEGKLGQLETTFERIKRDPRHTNIVVFAMTPIGARNLATWSMSHFDARDVEARTYEARGYDPHDLRKVEELARLLAEVTSKRDL